MTGWVILLLMLLSSVSLIIKFPNIKGLQNVTCGLCCIFSPLPGEFVQILYNGNKDIIRLFQKYVLR